MQRPQPQGEAVASDFYSEVRVIEQDQRREHQEQNDADNKWDVRSGIAVDGDGDAGEQRGGDAPDE